MGRKAAPAAMWAPLVLVLSAVALTEGAVIEKFFTVGTTMLDPTCSGTFRETVVINGQFPGPTIEATEGDTLVIHLTNNQPLGVTLHWHGLAQQDAQWYDGVPGVTQCLVKQGKSFTIVLPIRGQWGTFWYHAHSNQMRNTVHGIVVIHPPRDSNPEPLPVKITGEIVLSAGDWYPQTSAQLDATILSAPYPGFPTPTAFHINGRTLCGAGPQYFVVSMRKWYRLRIVNTGLWGSINLRVENHTMILHESEGGFLLHKQVSMLDVYPGQSYSVLLFTNQKPANYWIVTNSRYDVEKAVVLPGAAVLVYESGGLGQTTPNSPFPKGPQGADRNLWGIKQQSKLRSPYYNQELQNTQISKLVVLEMNQNTLRDSRQVFSMNNVSFVFNSSTPFLLADYQGTSSKVYSSTILPDLPPRGLTQQKDGPTKFSPYVVTIPYGAWVQIVFQNHLPPGGLHPFHVHGQNFYVVAQGNGTFNPKKWNKYKYNLKNPVLRNTVACFDSYWVAIRFRALNPGQWIVHCHLEQHADQGLLTVLKVLWPTPNGLSGPKPLGPPPSDYPAC